MQLNMYTCLTNLIQIHNPNKKILNLSEFILNTVVIRKDISTKVII